MIRFPLLILLLLLLLLSSMRSYTLSALWQIYLDIFGTFIPIVLLNIHSFFFSLVSRQDY